MLDYFLAALATLVLLALALCIKRWLAKERNRNNFAVAQNERIHLLCQQYWESPDEESFRLLLHTLDDLIQNKTFYCPKVTKPFNLPGEFRGLYLTQGNSRRLYVTPNGFVEITRADHGERSIGIEEIVSRYTAEGVAANIGRINWDRTKLLL